MAVLLDQYLPFDSGPGGNAQEAQWREMMKHMLGSAAGVIRGFANSFNSFGDSSGMQVKVDTGECFMRGHFGKSTAIKVLPIAANSSGSARKDRVVLRTDFVGNEIEVDVLTGTPSGSPVAPAVTQNSSIWETSLAVVDVANGAVTITSGNVVDNRTYTTVIAKYSRNTTFNITTSASFTEFQCNTIEIPSGDVVANSTMSQFTLNRAGLWTLNWYAGFTGASVGGRAVQIRDSAATVYVESSMPTNTTGTNTFLTASTTERFSSGQIVRPIVWQTTGGALTVLAGATFTMSWIGP